MASTAKKVSTKKPAAKAKAPAKKPSSQVASKVANRAITMAKKKDVSVVKDAASVLKGNAVEPTTLKGFKIVNNVVLPPRATTPGESAYPFADLPVNAAIFVDSLIDTAKYPSKTEAAKAQSEASATKANRVNGAIRRFTKRNPDFKFTARTVRNGKELGFDGDVGIVVKRIK